MRMGMRGHRDTLTPQIKGYIEWRLEHYHEDKRQLNEARQELMPSNTPNYSSDGGGGGNGRPSEALAMKLVSDRYINETQRNIDAIDHVLDRLEPIDRKLVDLVYWKGTHTKEGAALALNMSRRTGYRHINVILQAIALELGLISFERLQQ